MLGSTESRVVHHQTRAGVAVLTIDQPPVNLLSRPVRQDLCAGLERAEADPDVRAIIITARERVFIAGADISELGKPSGEPSLGELFARLERSPKPILAALNGVTLGGGLEVALCCDYRLASPTASLGLPEVKLGLLPGGGGTQRLPRLVGAARALELILFGEPISAPAAAELGIVDAIITGDLVEGALTFAADLIARGAPRRRLSAGPSAGPSVGSADDSKVIERIHARATEAMPGRFALDMIVECVRAAIDEPDFDAGIGVERRCFERCVAHPQHGALKHLFFAERECWKVPGLSRKTPGRAVRCAAFHASRDDKSASLRDHMHRAGITCIHAGELGQVEQADVVVLGATAPPEFIAGLGVRLASTAVLLSVSSEHDLEALADASGCPDRTLGVARSPSGRVIEFIRGERTNDLALATAMKLSRRLAVVPVVSSRASIGARMHAAFVRELDSLLCAGVSAERLDRCLTRFGFGPQQLTPVAASSETETETETDDAVLLERCLAAWANEGRRMLDEGVALRASDIDIVATRGFGFPELGGGPMYWQQQRGVA